MIYPRHEIMRKGKTSYSRQINQFRVIKKEFSGVFEDAFSYIYETDFLFQFYPFLSKIAYLYGVYIAEKSVKARHKWAARFYDFKDLIFEWIMWDNSLDISISAKNECYDLTRESFNVLSFGPSISIDVGLNIVSAVESTITMFFPKIKQRTRFCECECDNHEEPFYTVCKKLSRWWLCEECIDEEMEANSLVQYNGTKGVYFIQGKDTGRIKIGYSTNIADRLNALRTMLSEEFETLAVLQGVKQEKETELHQQFNFCRKRGEWFLPHEAIFDYIRASIKLN